jgi:hypothetical protein
MEINKGREGGKVMGISRLPSPIQIARSKNLENVEYFTNLGSIITNAARCTRDIKSSLVMVKVA